MDPSLTIPILAFTTLFGATVGSFLNVCIWRLPREGISVSRPRRSFCPSCGTPIGWQDNIPILGWLLLGGRCRHCQAPISSRYVLVEALTAVLFLLVAYRWVVLGELSVGAAAALLALVAGLVVAAFIDLELRIIPDEVTLGGMLLVPLVAVLVPDLQGSKRDRIVAAGLERIGAWMSPLSPGGPLSPDGPVSPSGPLSPPGARTLTGGLGPVPIAITIAIVAAAGVGAFLLGAWGHASYWRRFQKGEARRPLGTVLCGALAGTTLGLAALIALRPDLTAYPRVYSLAAALWGMLVGAGLVYAVGFVGTKVFRKPAMGLGDVKLMGLLGAFTGWIGAVQGFFLACFLGSAVGIVILVRRRSRYIPFGPFLALGCLLVLLWPGAFEKALAWYLGLFRA